MTQRPIGLPEDPKAGPAGAATHAPAETWQDWVTIWQSELNALATDREPQQIWLRLVESWAVRARAAGAFLPACAQSMPGHDGASGRAPAEPSARAAPSAAAPDAGDSERQRADLERLARRVAELERRLAELGGDGKG